MKLKLDTSRNRLLITNTTFAVYLMAIGFGSYLTGNICIYSHIHVHVYSHIHVHVYSNINIEV
jgi:hypothetical protein